MVDMYVSLRLPDLADNDLGPDMIYHLGAALTRMPSLSSLNISGQFVPTYQRQ